MAAVSTPAWWQSLLDQFGQQYIAPEFLRKPALRQWLAEEPVANDLKAIATWRIMATDQDEAATRDRLAQSYSNRTGEAPYLAARPIDVVVAILVAGYIGAIRADDRAVAGMLHTGISRIDDQLGRLRQAVSPLTDPITHQTHTEHAVKDLARILTLRAIDPARARSDIQKNCTIDLTRVTLPRPIAVSRTTFDIGRHGYVRVTPKHSMSLESSGHGCKDDEPNRDLSIIDALISEMDGHPDRAIQILRDNDDSDTRTALFALLVRSKDVGPALDMYADRIATADARFFTAVGWKNWACGMAEVGRWEEAAQRLAEFDRTWSEAPALALVEGIINAQLLLPEERRSLTFDIRLYLGMNPNQGEQAATAHRRATACIEIAQSGLQDIGGTGLERSVTDWSHWLRLMNPKEDNKLDAHDEIRNDLESRRPRRHSDGLRLGLWCFV